MTKIDLRMTTDELIVRDEVLLKKMHEERLCRYQTTKTVCVLSEKLCINLHKTISQFHLRYTFNTEQIC